MDGINEILCKITTEISEAREKIIESTIQTIDNCTHEHIIFDKSKVFDAFDNYTAKVPVKKDDMYLCPKCESSIARTFITKLYSWDEFVKRHACNYCSGCGKRLDWETVFKETENDLS